MRDALARKFYEEDDYENDECLEAKPSYRTKTATRRRNYTQALPFVVVADETDDTNANSYAAMMPETASETLLGNEEETEAAHWPLLPTNTEANRPRQWTSGTRLPSSDAAYSSEPQPREWGVSGVNAQAYSVPTYSATLRSRRTRSTQRTTATVQVEAHPVRHELADEVRGSLVSARQALSQVYHDFAPATNLKQAEVTYPNVPSFDYEVEPATTVWKDWLIQHKSMLLISVVGIAFLFVALHFGLSLGSSRDDSSNIFGYSGQTNSASAIANPKTSVATGNGDVVLGPPTITPQQINQVLSQYHSPAVGVGQGMYDLGVKYGIDPAFALGFFVHESSAGTQGVATVTKSIGNIRATDGYASYEGFRKYPTWEAGIEDWYSLIKSLYVDSWHLTTLQQIVPRYAPSADHNDPIAYINDVHRLVASWRSQNH